MASKSEPPYYIFQAHSSLNSAQASASTTLSHPSIQYHYKDDSPLALLPSHADEHVLVLNFDPKDPYNSTAQSLSQDLAVTQLRMEEAPGAAAEENGIHNDTMFIIDTTSNDGLASAQPDRPTAASTLAQFRQRNVVLRRALDYPLAPVVVPLTPDATPRLK